MVAEVALRHPTMVLEVHLDELTPVSNPVAVFGAGNLNGLGHHTTEPLIEPAQSHLGIGETLERSVCRVQHDLVVEHALENLRDLTDSVTPGLFHLKPDLSTLGVDTNPAVVEPVLVEVILEGPIQCLLHRSRIIRIHAQVGQNFITKSFQDEHAMPTLVVSTFIIDPSIVVEVGFE